MPTAFYPPTPANVPADLTQPTPRYKLLVGAMLVSIILFMVLYLGLLAASCYLVYAVITQLRFASYGLWTILFHLGSIVGACMLVLFLVKVLFKKNRAAQDGRLRLVPAAHPELVAFIDQLCDEAGAPRPKHILINPEVNASVFYDDTLLSLFWPVRKNLLIGLGLVNGLNLTEFKAVIAHEFGHFAQRSMKLGSYVYTANRIIHDMVYERDQWDDLLAQWRTLDVRVSVVAWLMTAVIWVVRKLLELAYQGIHLVHASLSREMEFQADRVAVRLAGSDAITNALFQLSSVNWAFERAKQQLSTALEHRLATDDIFFHQTRNLTLAAAERKPRPAPAAPADPAARRIFTPDEVQVIQMYASHPADHLRELNAKAHYVPGPEDTRSPWLLFAEADQLRRSVTHKLYELLELQPTPEVRPAAEIADFLAAETEEMTYPEHYAGVYDMRLVTLTAPENLAATVAGYDFPTGLLAARQDLYGPDLQARMQAYHTRRTDLQKLELFRTKQTKDREFRVEGVTYPAAEATTVAHRLQAEDEAFWEWAKEFDQRALAVHWQLLAGQFELRNEWLERYRFQYAILQPLEAVRHVLAQANQLIQEIVRKGQVSEQQAHHYTSQFEEQRAYLHRMLRATQQVAVLPLAHMQDFDSLYEFALRELDFPASVTLHGTWVNGYLHLLSTVDDRLRRLYFKNLGVLLRLQEAAVAAYASPAGPPAPAAAAS